MQTRRRTRLTLIAIRLIQMYRNSLSLLMIDSCRLIPSCSEYAEEALRQYGAIYGGWMAARRLLRCHPFGRPGIDPVK